MNPYIPNTPPQTKTLLQEIGAKSFHELVQDIPNQLLIKDLNLDLGLDEFSVAKKVSTLAEKNTVYNKIYAGCGAYDHYVPAAVSHITGRSEFYTAYTPYQPEISQGTLTAIFEYQTMICRLTGMDISNASLYDGANALVETVNIMVSSSKKNKVIVSQPINPNYQAVLDVFCAGQGIEIIYTPPNKVSQYFADDIAGVIFFQPNFFGELHDFSQIISAAKAKNILIGIGILPISLGLIEAPGNYGADIVFGEGQSLGNSLNFGGPYLGILAVKEAFLRQMPGRIVGETVDKDGKRAFVLTMQTREQHIRREKATSNICSNQALCALTATVYLSLLGPSGLTEVAKKCMENTNYFIEKILQIKNIELISKPPVFQEFVIKLPTNANKVIEIFKQHNILAGVDLGQFSADWKNYLSIAVTEKINFTDIDEYVSILVDSLNPPPLAKGRG